MRGVTVVARNHLSPLDMYGIELLVDLRLVGELRVQICLLIFEIFTLPQIGYSDRGLAHLALIVPATILND